MLVEQYQLADSSSVRRLELPVALPPGPGSIHWFTLNSTWSTNTSILQLTVLAQQAPHHQPATTNFYLPSAPYQLALTPGPLDVSLTVLDAGGSRDEEAVIVVRKDSDAVALFLTLTTLAAGRFSHNCFHLYGRETNVTFIAFGELNRTLLTQSLRWEHANLYSQPSLQQNLARTSHHQVVAME